MKSLSLSYTCLSSKSILKLSLLLLSEAHFLFYSWAQGLHLSASLVMRGAMWLISGQRWGQGKGMLALGQTGYEQYRMVGQAQYWL